MQQPAIAAAHLGSDDDLSETQDEGVLDRPDVWTDEAREPGRKMEAGEARENQALELGATHANCIRVPSMRADT